MAEIQSEVQIFKGETLRISIIRILFTTTIKVSNTDQNMHAF